MNFVKTGEPEIRPWYREPWPWVLIAIPLITIIASGYTLYLAISHPDYLIVEEEAYNTIVEELRAAPSPGSEQIPEGRSPNEEDDDH